MPEPKQDPDQTIRENAYYLWEREGRPHGHDQDHWLRAAAKLSKPSSPPDDPIEDEEKVLAGRADANIPAMLTKDVPGG
jgi:hypothetical protein